MKFPSLTPDERIQRLEPPRHRAPMVLDTDTYNEVDDQFAVAHALLSPEQMDCQALYAAPFHNSRSDGPKDGMEKSYEEILRMLKLMRRPAEGLVYRGSTDWLKNHKTPVQSDAAQDLIRRAMAMPEDEPLYVVAIGAITNVASALLMEPELVRRIVVIWLGGQPLSFPHAREFNICGDKIASQVLLDSGVPLVLIPCGGVSELLQTTIPELEYHLSGQNELCDFLVDRVKGYVPDRIDTWSKVIWDIAGTAWLINADHIPTHLVPAPIFTKQGTWRIDPDRHIIRMAWSTKRDGVYHDVFAKLKKAL